MPKLKPLGRFDSALMQISASRHRETSAARKILALLEPLDSFEADNAMELVEEAMNRAQDVSEDDSDPDHGQQLALVDDGDPSLFE